jgi:hypothetical protein
MKKLAFAALLALAIALCSCGSGTNTPVKTTGAGGIWEAQLYGGTGQAALLDFTSQFSVGASGGTTSSGTLDITSFHFINSNSCFPVSISTTEGNSGESGSATLVTSASNQVTGSLTYNVAAGSDTLLLTTTASSGLPGGQVTGMSVNSALQNGVVTGNWTVSGSCSGSGTFVMCQEAAPNGDGGCDTAN